MIYEIALRIGRGVVAGASALGLGALVFYGLGLSNDVGILDKSHAWPQYVRDRIHSTYLYFGGGLGVTAASAVAVARTPALMNLMMKNSWMVSFLTRFFHLDLAKL